MLYTKLRGMATGPVRLTEPAHQHLTVHFLGATAETALPDLCRHAADICCQRKRFPISLNRLTFQPVGPAPRMLWLQGERNRAFSELVAAFRNAMPTAESRFPQPHVTLARFKSFRQPPVHLPELSPVTFVVDAVELWQSFTLPQGARYQCLQRWPLQAPT